LIIITASGRSLNGYDRHQEKNPLNTITKYWGRISPAWRSSITIFLAGRILYTIWSLVILYSFPTIVNNAAVYGKPALLAYDMKLEKGYVYSRMVDGSVLTFKYFTPGQITDDATHSIWSLEQGAAIAGKYAGRSLELTDYPAEKAFGRQPQSVLLLSLWQRYDTKWYLQIARSGYSAEDGSMAFLPVYPILIRLLGNVLGDDLLAALLISNVALFFGLVFLFDLTSAAFDQASAKRTLAYYVIFPTSFFLFAAYTEALFFLWVVLAFYSAYRKHWILAGVLGALATLTRMQGVILFIPLLLIFIRQVRKQRLSLWHGLSLVLIPCAFLAYQLFTAGNYAASLESHWLARTSTPWENFTLAFRSFLDSTGSLLTLFNLVVAIGFLGMCIPILKRLPLEYFLYTALVLVVPLFRINEGEPLVSYGRYVLAAFPVFMILGNWGKMVRINRLVIYLGFPLALTFCALFLMWSWVG
jgi:Mannosyltransferase (PIG-V)